MAINITNTNYNGEVLERLLTKATTGNQLVQRGLIRVVPNVRKKYSIPRLKTGTMLQKRKEMPEDADSKGDFNYSEKELVPHDFMAFTTFNPRSFEEIWRPYQPKGELVFAQLPADVQNQLLDALAKQVNFELGGHFINGVYEDGEDDSRLFDGILTKIFADKEVLHVQADATESMITRLQKVRKATPDVLRANPNFVYLMSVNDADQYDDELTQRMAKGANWTDTNAVRFKGTQIQALAQWPDGVIVGAVATPNDDSNLWAAVNLQDDFNVIQIDKLTNAGERYFFKMLMMADTNDAFGEEIVLLDVREAETVNPSGTTITTTGQLQQTTVDADSADKVFSVTATESLPGAMLRVTNSNATNKAKIGNEFIPAKSTVQLYYDGKTWNKGTVVTVKLAAPVTEATIAAEVTVNQAAAASEKA